MDFWNISKPKRAVLVGILSWLLMFSGTSTQSIGEVLAESSTAAVAATSGEQTASEVTEASSATSEEAVTTATTTEANAEASSSTATTTGTTEAAAATSNQATTTEEVAPVHWTIALEANGGTLSEGVSADACTLEAIENGDAVTVPSVYAREGYEFTGWSTVADPAAWWEQRNAALAADPSSPEPDDTPLFVPVEASLSNLSYSYVVLEDGTVRQVGAEVAAQGTDGEGRAVQTCDLRARVVEGRLALYAQWELIPTEQDEAQVAEEAASGAVASTSDTAETDSSAANVATSGTTEAASDTDTTVASGTQNAASQEEEEAESTDGSSANATTTSTSLTGVSALLSSPTAVIDSATGDEEATEVLDEVEQELQTQTILSSSKRMLLSTSSTPSQLGSSLLRNTSTTSNPISSFTLTWNTSDSDSKAESDTSTLSLEPKDISDVPDDTPLSMQAKLSFTLSGNDSFEAGSVQFKIPAQFVTNRDGNKIGSLTIDLPEEPDASHYFAYRLVTPSDATDPYYLITNTRTLDATATDEIVLTYSDITPHEVVSAYATIATAHSLTANMRVTTAGSTSTETSSELYAKIYTSEALDSVRHNGGTVVAYADAPTTVQNALSAVATSAEKSMGDYLLVRWNTYASAKGNQAFTLSLTDTLGNITTTDGTVASTDAVVLGTSTLAADSPGTTFTKDIIGNKVASDSLTSGYIPTGETRYENLWTAYPKSLFTAGNTYTINNSVTWTLTPTDSQNPSLGNYTITQEKNITYTPPTTAAFPDSLSNNYSISAETLDPHAYSTSDNTSLNDLLASKDTTIGFTVTGQGEIMNHTKDANDNTAGVDIAYYINQGTKNVGDYYHKQYVTVEVADDALYFNRDYTSELGSAEYYVSKVVVQDPLVYTYKHTNDDETQAWDFIRNTTGQLPSMALYGLSESSGGTAESWTKLATVSYNESNKRTVTAAATDVTTDGSTVTLNESLGITRVKLIASTEDYDKIELSYSPYVTLRGSSTRLEPLVNTLFASSTNPTATMRNDATLLAYNGDAVSAPDSASINPANAQIKQSAGIIALSYSYTRGTAMRRTDDLDNVRYGTSMDHSSPYVYLRGVTPSVGVTSSNSMTYDKASDLDTKAMQAKLHYTASVHEQSNVTSKELYQSYVSTGAIAAETSGTWYDLLPPGVEPDLSSITLRDADALQDAYTVKDYKESGRTLLVVKAKLVPVVKYSSSSDYWAEGYYDEPTISFDAVYNYVDYAAGTDEKDTLVNVIAFESGNQALGNVSGYKGEPDDPTLSSPNNNQTTAAVSGVADTMKELNASHNNPVFVYARSENSITISRVVTESTKAVASDAEGIYRTGTGTDANQVNVYAGQSYTYRINVVVLSKASDIVIYDALEGYVPSEGSDSNIKNQTWKGTLASVDTSKLTAAGVAPVVYYSTTVTSSNIESCTNLTNTSNWTQVAPEDLSTVKAIAIDCHKSTNGSDFSLTAGTPLPVYVHMTAPVASTTNPIFKTIGDNEDDPNNNSHAFNNAYITSSDGSGSTGYTKVGILPYKLTVSKAWDDGDNRDQKRPESVTVNLVANGEAVADTSIALGSAMAGASGYSDDGWTYTYSDLPSADSNGNNINYTVAESAVENYTPSYTRTDDTHLVVTNKHIPDTVKVVGNVTWKDNGNFAGARPSTVVVRLYADGIYQDSQRIAADSEGNCSYSFTDLPAYSDGKAIVYTVQEESVDYYATEYSTATTSGTTTNIDITNTYSLTGHLVIQKTVENTSYAPADASFPFKVELFDPDNKDDGKDSLPLSDSYPYTVLDSSNATVSSGAVSTGGTISLKAGQKAIIEGIPAQSTYTVTEQSVAGFTSTSSENTSGVVTASTSADNAVTVSFVNTYSSSGSYQLQATKVLTGRQLARGKFQFEAYLEGELASTTSNLAGSAPDSSNQSTGDVLFPRINVTNADFLGTDGTLARTYTIKEVNDAKAGYTYDSTDKTVTVTLKDNGDGTITATQTAETDSDTTFNNTYSATGSFNIVAYKSLVGRTLSANEFTFTLEGLTTGAPVLDNMTTQNAADGTVTFSNIPLTTTNAGKSYIYRVTEQAGKDETVTYSTEVVYYRVDITDDGAGRLTATTTVVKPILSGYTEGDPDSYEPTGVSPTITNTLKPGSLSITKNLAEGTAATSTSFTFKVRLTGDDVASSYTYTVGGETKTAEANDGVLTIALTGGQTATISNIAAGTAYQVLEESASGWQLSGQSGTSGTISANTTSVATFTNAKASDPVTTHLYASTTIDDKAPSNEQFSFKLTAANGAPMPSGATESELTKTNDAAGLVDFGSISYTAAGTYTYTITETAGSDSAINYDSSAWTATVTVSGDTSSGLSASVSYAKTDNPEAANSTAATFANTTNPGTLTVTNTGVHVTSANQQSFNFTVELKKNGKPITSTAYSITGSTDSTPVTSTTGIYSFALIPGQTATFSSLPAGTTYTVYESSQPDGWTQTGTSNTRGTITAGGTAEAVVTNTYAATGSITLQAKKTMKSGLLAAGDFTFKLLEGDTTLQTVSNLAPTSGSSTANILFNQIDYDVTNLFTNSAYAEKTYAYTMQEVVPSDATNSNGKKWSEANDTEKADGGFISGNVIYGSDVIDGALSQTVYVKVADAGNGRLSVQKVTSATDETVSTTYPQFTNSAASGYLKVTATAVGTNEATADTEFNYAITLIDAAGNPITGSVPITYYHADDTVNEKTYPDGQQQGEPIKQIQFSDTGYAEGLFLIKSGEYFILSGLPAGATYKVESKENTFGFTQTSVTDASGTIVATETVTASFTNTYVCEGSIQLKARAKLKYYGKTTDVKTGYCFTFQLYDEDGNLLQTKSSSDVVGEDYDEVTFDAIGFAAADAGTEDNPKVHRFRIVEVNDSQKNIVYDTHSGWVNVSVYDSGSDEVAKLTISPAYEHATGAVADSTPETFTNYYQVATELPTTGGSGLAIPVAAVVIVITGVAARRMRRRQRKG